ncbi:hypothetical protein [Deinococcus multiflagellatus]|uniref:Alpha-galactosidase n=1 Tax=Deinococcus multiflagellatus TaxID=1656887 RepID=A0ABW1ZGS9_9DEIO
MREWTLNVNPAEVRVLVSGFQSWSEAELRPLTDTQAVPLMRWRHEQGHDPGFLPSGQAGVWRSHTMLALVRPDGSGWVGMAGDATQTFIQWEARAHGDHITVTCALEGPEVPLHWEDTRDVIATLEARAADLGQAMHARTPTPLRVWCSWYSYYRAVTLEAMLDNARRARAAGLPFDVFQLDDGFQADLGDWTEPSAHFGGHARDLPAPCRPWATPRACGWRRFWPRPPRACLLSTRTGCCAAKAASRCRWATTGAGRTLRWTPPTPRYWRGCANWQPPRAAGATPT